MSYHHHISVSALARKEERVEPPHLHSLLPCSLERTRNYSEKRVV
jgi:hypothetical protein